MVYLSADTDMSLVAGDIISSDIDHQSHLADKFGTSLTGLESQVQIQSIPLVISAQVSSPKRKINFFRLSRKIKMFSLITKITKMFSLVTRNDLREKLFTRNILTEKKLILGLQNTTLKLCKDNRVLGERRSD